MIEWQNELRSLDSEPYLSKEEVAQKLLVSVRTLERWMREDDFPYYKITRLVCFRWSEVQAYMAIKQRNRKGNQSLNIFPGNPPELKP